MANLNLKWMVICVVFLIMLMVIGGCARDRTWMGVALTLGGGPRAECPAGTHSVNNVCLSKKDWPY